MVRDRAKETYCGTVQAVPVPARAHSIHEKPGVLSVHTHMPVGERTTDQCCAHWLSYCTVVGVFGLWATVVKLVQVFWYYAGSSGFLVNIHTFALFNICLFMKT